MSERTNSEIPCCICELRHVYMYLHINGTDKNICVPCCEIIEELKKKYIHDIKHKRDKLFLHRKIEDPDLPQ